MISSGSSRSWIGWTSGEAQLLHQGQLIAQRGVVGRQSLETIEARLFSEGTPCLRDLQWYRGQGTALEASKYGVRRAGAAHRGGAAAASRAESVSL